MVECRNACELIIIEVHEYKLVAIVDFVVRDLTYLIIMNYEFLQGYQFLEVYIGQFRNAIKGEVYLLQTS